MSEADARIDRLQRAYPKASYSALFHMPQALDGMQTRRRPSSGPGRPRRIWPRCLSAVSSGFPSAIARPFLA